MTVTEKARLRGERVWLVTDGTAERDGWRDALVEGLREAGAAAVDVLGVPGAFGWTARTFLEQGAEQVARAFRFVAGRDGGASPADAMRSGGPDVVIVDAPGVAGPLEFLRDTTRSRAAVIGVVSRFEPPSEWQAARIHAAVVPHGAYRAPLGAVFGEDRVVLAGPPLPEAWLRRLDREALRASMGFAADHRVLLVDATTLVPATIETLMAQLRGAPSPLQALFFHGGVRESQDALRDAAAVHGVRARMFGELSGLEEVLAVADLVAVGAGGALVTPAVALGRPLLALDGRAAIPPLVEHGSMWALSSPLEMSRVVAEIAWDGVPTGLSEAAASAERRGGCAEVVDAVVGLAARREELLASPSVAPRPGPPTSAEGPEPGGSFSGGRFEEIGGTGSAAQVGPLDPSEAREQLARLIMEERRLENRLTEETRERDRWMRRQELAASEKDEELARVAEGRIQAHAVVVRQVGQQLEALNARKEAVRRRVAAGRRGASGGEAPPPADPSEDRFRSMEVEDELARLRRRLEDKPGDDGERR